MMNKYNYIFKPGNSTTMFYVNGQIMSRLELECFIYDYIVYNNLDGKLRNLLPHYDLHHNVRVSAVRLARECGFDIINCKCIFEKADS